MLSKIQYLTWVLLNTIETPWSHLQASTTIRTILVSWKYLEQKRMKEHFELLWQPVKVGVVVVCVLARVWMGVGGWHVRCRREGDRPSQFFLLQDNDRNHQLPRSFLILDALQVLWAFVSSKVINDKIYNKTTTTSRWCLKTEEIRFIHVFYLSCYHFFSYDFCKDLVVYVYTRNKTMSKLKTSRKLSIADTIK